MARAPDPLTQYNEKRDFEQTQEPRGEIGRASGARFIVQKHAASRLHYDFRLEWQGVLLSWAVTKGPSPDPSQKRLAVRTEDHPLSYGDFEGTIPKGQYGGGTVMLWDDGTWAPQEDFAKGLKQGKLKFTLQGHKMQGGWALVRMRSEGKRENWLLIKERDDYAEENADALTKGEAISVKSGRAMDEIAKAAPARESRSATRARSRKAPGFVEPQLATLVSTVPEGDGWLHETKFDGYRCLAILGKNGTRLFTRSGKDWTDKFAALKDVFAPLPCDSALIDGEVMAARVSGSAFSSLQAALKDGGALIYFAFDLLKLDGKDLRELPQIERRERLASLFSGISRDAPLRMSDHITGHGRDVFAAACKSGAEGIISKRIDAPYRSTRSKAWLKVKCTRRQEFVIIGTSPSEKAHRPFASLLIATHEDGDLIYKGRVGTGFSDSDLDHLAKAMRRRKTSAAKAVPDDIARHANWMRPDLVAEIEFAEFTADGLVRHGSYLGLRQDKPAKDVTLELPQENTMPTQVEGIEISNAERQVFPDAGCTKGDIARHYHRIGARMIALGSHRPLSLYRCPGGWTANAFSKNTTAAVCQTNCHASTSKKATATPPLIFMRRARKA